ncbi:MAG: hypothetical protein COA73_03840 [Candidatus Hydrogenedentota bacterium]|nr:MAG: hypothetical protein COA73_03840 [Candidatus Hydrogenedentota bacterium]
MDTIAPKPILYSIGHSTHTIDTFISLLKRHDINAIADVRSMPYSRFSPQFSDKALEASLKENNIAYVFLGKELGVRRSNPDLYSNNKIDYRKISTLSSYRQGILRMIDGAGRMNVAMMCAEKDPLTCHRTILIARNAKLLVDDIRHILEDGSIETQSQLEDRLLLECKMNNEELFSTREQRLEDAYDRRALEVAYEEPASHA